MINGRASSPILWLGHLIGAKPHPWKHMPVPGIILNAIQVVNKTNNNSKALRILLSNFDVQRLMIDSGGYNLLKNPSINFDIQQLVHLYQHINADIYVSLDVPPHPALTLAERKKRWDETKKNAILLHQLVDKPIMPVVHGYSLRELQKNSAELQKIIDESNMIGFGGIVPLFKVHRDRALKLIYHLRNKFPDSFFHVFGVGSVSSMLLLAAIGVDSMDTIGWRIKAAYGAIQLPGVGDRFVTPNQSSGKHRKKLSVSEIELLAQCKCPVCSGKSIEERLSLLDNSKKSTFYNRAMHNAWVFTQEFELVCKHLNGNTILDFMKSRLNGGYWKGSYEHVLRLLGQ